MNDNPYTITFGNGTVLERVTLNSTTWVSYIPLSPAITSRTHDTIVASNGTDTQVFKLAEVRDTASPNEGEFWFHILEQDPVEVAMGQMRSDIDYLAMMNDVEL